MKPFVLAVIFGGLFGALAGCAPIVATKSPFSTEIKHKKADQEVILTTVFRDHLGNSTAEGEIKVLFVRQCEINEDRRCKEVTSSRVYFEQFDGKPFRIKTKWSGHRYRPEGDLGISVCRDRETGQRCDLITVQVESIEGDIARVSLSWGSTSVSALGTTYNLRKVNGKWLIEWQATSAGA